MTAASATAAPATSITVSTVAGLESAIRSDTQGATIYLASGTYSGVNISNLNAAHPIVITSLNAAHPAVISGFSVTNSSNIEFLGLQIASPLGLNPAPNRVTSSHEIAFVSDAFSGSTAASPANNNDGLLIVASDDVHVDNSTFSQLCNGIQEADSNNIAIYNNVFTHLGGDGVDNVGSSNISINANTFTDFANGNGIHPDAIQFWTAGTDWSVSNINISDNVMSRGSGTAFQGIFMSDEVGDLSYEDVKITGNTVLGGDYNGIRLEHGVDATISDNTVIGDTGMQSWICLYESRDVNLTDNQAQEMVFLNQAQSQLSGGGNSVPLRITSSEETEISNIAPVTSTVAVSTVSTSLVGTLDTTLVLSGEANISATANALNDRIIANAGADTLYAGTGADTFTEGAGTDTFVFGLHSNHDTITNFGLNGHHDVIDLSAYLDAGYHPTLAAVGANTVISLDGHGDTITLLGVAPSSLHWISIGLSH